MADVLGYAARTRPLVIRHSPLLFLVTDVAVLAVTLSVFGHFGHGEWQQAHMAAMIAWAVAMGHYVGRPTPHAEIGQLAQGIGLVALADLLVRHQAGGQWHILPVAGQSAAVLLAMLAGRLLTRRLLIAVGLWQIPILVVGNGNAQRIAAAMESASSRGYKAAAVLSPAELDVRLDTLPADIRMAVLELETSLHEDGRRLIRALRERGIDVALAPSLTELPVLGIQAHNFFSHDVVLLTADSGYARPLKQAAKRLLDVAASILLLLLAAPVLLVVALLVKSDGGPLLFGHWRVGRHGTKFRCWKFRTMVPDAEQVLQQVLDSDPARAEEWRKTCKLKEDPRVTAIGGLLRRSSLDELPQLLNVAAGQMSLIGPRPVTRGELERYGEARDCYLSVRPGITGLWQVLGRNDSSYAQRVVLDAWYVRNWSLWHDLVILLKTVPVVLGRNGAY